MPQRSTSSKPRRAGVKRDSQSNILEEEISPPNSTSSSLPSNSYLDFVLSNPGPNVTSQRRQLHNMLERKRRSGLRDLFQDLATELWVKEQDQSNAPPKVVILQQAAEEIKTLSFKVEQGQKQAQALKKENVRLQNRLIQIQNAKALKKQVFKTVNRSLEIKIMVKIK
eukprot:Pgem_evm1s5409